MGQRRRILIYGFIFLAAMVCCKSANALANKSFEIREQRFEIEGLDRTSASFIELEVRLLMLESSPHDFALELEQRLKNFGIFASVRVEKIERDLPISQNTHWRITIQEKWTTIPIAKVTSGGGVLQSVLGIYDPNIFGKRVEIGMQAESLQGALSYVIWLKEARLFGSRAFLDFQNWDTQRLRFKYDQAKDEPEIIKAFLLTSKKSHIALGFELTTHLKVQTFLESQLDSFSTQFVPEPILSQTNSQTIPPATRVNHVGLGIDFGRLNNMGEHALGSLLSLNYRYGKATETTIKDFYSAHLTISHFQNISSDFFYAQRFKVGTTDTSVLQYWNYLGGLESIRGFSDNRFASRHYWLSNSELRRSLYYRPNWSAQAVWFADMLGIDEGGRDLGSIAAASVGIGARVIVPKIYRLVFRLDYAHPVFRKDSMPWSFGVQQFF